MNPLTTLVGSQDETPQSDRGRHIVLAAGLGEGGPPRSVGSSLSLPIFPKYSLGGVTIPM
jgi:hypothetical protein